MLTSQYVLDQFMNINCGSSYENAALNLKENSIVLAIFGAMD